MTGADLIALAKKHPLSSLCGLLILICGLLVYFRLDAIEVSQAEYEAKAGEAAKMIANVKNAPGLEEQVAEIQALGKDLDTRLINPGQLAVNLQYFYKLESDHAVKLVDVRQNPVRTLPGKPNFIPVPFSVTVQGSYDQVMKFLNALQNGKHFCRINTAAFNKPGGTGAGGEAAAGGGEVSVSLNLELLGQP